VDPGVEGSNPFTHPIFCDMERASIIEKARRESKDGKIPCRKALRLAAEMGVSPKELGDLLNEVGIKVATCQLGCFP
jgi:hypothetical protein